MNIIYSIHIFIYVVALSFIKIRTQGYYTFWVLIFMKDEATTLFVITIVEMLTIHRPLS